MAAKKQQQGIDKPKKRKQNPDGKTEPGGSASKKPKLLSSNSQGNISKKPSKPFVKQERKSNETKKPQSGEETKVRLSKREGRIKAKEMAEARKKKRKKHYTLEQELASLWEKMRQRNIAKDERSKIITEALGKMKGKIPEIASSHVSSRVLQTCVKHCSHDERQAIFEELKPHFLTFSNNAYAVHLVLKMLEHASKKQLAECISTLRGHVATLLRHSVGSIVVEQAYKLANASQKQELLMELYSPELQLFKDLASIKESRFVDVISKLKLPKGSVLRHMASVIQPILEKGIIDHSILHRLLIEYLSIAPKTSAAEILQQLSGLPLVRMMHTKDGSRIVIACIKHGSAKERKKIVKGMKDNIEKIPHDHFGSLVLTCIVSTIDDTKLVTKIIIRKLQALLKDLLLDKSGRRPLLQLLHPNCSRYFSPDDMASLNFSLPALSAVNELEANQETESLKDEKSEKQNIKEDEMAGANESTDPENLQSTVGGKKDALLRRQELLVHSGLAENLIDTCIENAGEFLKSNFGKEVLYEVAIGGYDGILHPSMDEKLNTLHEAIASLAAKSKSEESDNEHVLENFHSNRTIRKLILESASFASTFWLKALKGNSRLWAQGHSSRVLCAYLESSDPNVKELAKEELQTLIDGGILKLPENQPSAK
ncbi:hypothetical protein Tsubulata_011712 [Turnera subulata]|uniref:PUM-HD domain-containing protein n=1 Tax=Turnera subulata TaxID=218843 RepID=A0A9Q0JKD4_9ROSI|nr:hypothetical protein Tsubulata_011712 [Turnera subulata]